MLAAYAFIAPSLVIIGVFLVYPMFQALRFSFEDYSVFHSDWVGIANYRTLIHDSAFWNALKNTIVYAGITTPVSVGLALGFALLLNGKVIGRGFFRASIFLPVITSLAIAAIAWQFLVDPDIGLLPYWLAKLGITTNGLGNPTWAMVWVIVVGVWKNVGFYTVMYLAGLQSIPRDLYEAAAVDGAARWTRFRTMTWPLLMNTTMFVFVIAAIAALQAFDQIFVMTHGGPFFRTETLVMLIYRLGFNDFQMGYAAAISWVLVLLVFALSLAQVKFFNKRLVRY
ncbi:MAG TPA: sugar ABC transporter permease [Gaiellaceae bacterium]|nr:sugar ABC transporter permease [Gaiellaceae bacterium]